MEMEAVIPFRILLPIGCGYKGNGCAREIHPAESGGAVPGKEVSIACCRTGLFIFAGRGC
jgi:hypothetical protein